MGTQDLFHSRERFRKLGANLIMLASAEDRSFPFLFILVQVIRVVIEGFDQIKCGIVQIKYIFDLFDGASTSSTK